MNREEQQKLISELTGVFNRLDPIGVGSSVAESQAEYQSQVYKVMRLLPMLNTIRELEIELTKLIKADFGISVRKDMLSRLSTGIWEAWRNPRDVSFHPPPTN